MMRMGAATADYSKDFDVFLVGDASPATFRRLITRVYWVRFVRPSSKSR